jgi:hypothetical protein
VALVPTHIVTVVTTFVFVKRILPTYIVEMAFEPIEYLDGENPWVMVRNSTVTGRMSFVESQQVLVQNRVFQGLHFLFRPLFC